MADVWLTNLKVICAPVAQLAEYLICNQGVAGSTPVWGSIIKFKKDGKIMLHEQLAIERKNTQETIKNLETMLKDMERDFAECARTGKSYCFFCAHDETCTCTNDADCNFKWQPHN